VNFLKGELYPKPGGEARKLLLRRILRSFPQYENGVSKTR
jgi:hypothetical protein